MRKALSIVISCTILMLSFAACYDLKEIDNIAYVMVVGVDKGVSDKWRLSIKYPRLAANGGSEDMGGGNGDGGQQDYSTAVVDAPSFFTGINMINTFISRELNFTHAKLLVFSEEIAIDGIIGEFIAPIIRYRQIRRHMNVAVCKGSALDFVKSIAPHHGGDLSKFISSLMDGSGNTGFFPETDLHYMYNGMKSTYRESTVTLVCKNDFESFIEEGEKWGDEFKSGGEYYAGDVPRKGGGSIEFFGSGVFKGDRMVGELNGIETRFLLMATSEYQKGLFTLSDPRVSELIIPLQVHMNKSPKISVDFKGDKPIINMDIELKGDMMAVQSRIHYESEDKKHEVEKAFSEYVKNGMVELIEKCQEWDTDVFGFGRGAVKNVRKFPTIEDWEEYNWHKHFGNADVNVEVDFIIITTGEMLKSSPIISEEGAE